jgi:hypothetical protein
MHFIITSIRFHESNWYSSSKFGQWYLRIRVADPTALRRGVIEHIQQQPNQPPNEYDYGHLLKHYDNPARTNTPLNMNVILEQDLETNWNIPTANTVCCAEAGNKLEDLGGYQLLMEKIRVAETTTTTVRLLCAIYTHSPMYPLARTAALTWGKECDGFMAFSNETKE